MGIITMKKMVWNPSIETVVVGGRCTLGSTGQTEWHSVQQVSQSEQDMLAGIGVQS